MNFFEILGGALVELFAEEPARPSAASSGRGGIALTWFAVERDELDDFVRQCRAAGVRPVCADQLLASLLENGREDLIPSAAMQIAERQLRNLDALIFVAPKD